MCPHWFLPLVFIWHLNHLEDDPVQHQLLLSQVRHVTYFHPFLASNHSNLSNHLPCAEVPPVCLYPSIRSFQKQYLKLHHNLTQVFELYLDEVWKEGKMLFKYQVANYPSSCTEGPHNSMPRHTHLNLNPPFREVLEMEISNTTEHYRLRAFFPREKQGQELLAV